MAFCSNCGAELTENAKFCAACGTAVENVKTENSSERKQEYAGKLIKCPACGDSLPSFAAICPSCGHEINSAQLTESLKEFINQIDEYDKQIASDIYIPQRGWKSWGIGKKVLWVLLNIITCCIPLAVYFALPLIRYNSTPPLTPIEKKRALLIKNFTFPNERETIINALLFIKAKTAFLASEKANRKSVYWMQLWITKTEHLYNKAQLLFPNDTAVETIYASIQDNHALIRSAAKKRAIIGICIIVIAVAVFFVPRIANNITDVQEQNAESNATNERYDKQYDWEEILLKDELPKPISTYGDINDNSEDRLYMKVYRVSGKEFKEYVEECKTVGYTIVDTNTETIYRAYNEERAFIDIAYSDYNDENSMSVLLELPEEIGEINWPKTSLVKLIPKPKKLIGYISSESSDIFGVYIDNVSKDEFNQYVDECIKKGFDNDYSRSEKYFSGEDNDGNSLTVEHEEFDVMHIGIMAYDFWD